MLPALLQTCRHLPSGPAQQPAPRAPLLPWPRFSLHQPLQLDTPLKSESDHLALLLRFHQWLLFSLNKSQVIIKTYLQGSQVKVLPFLWLSLPFPPSPTRSSNTAQTGEGCISPGTPHRVNHRPGALFLRRELAILLTIQIRMACRVGRGHY